MKTVTELRQKYESKLLTITEPSFEGVLVKAAFDNLEVVGPLCFNNFGYALRELLRHVFSRLAPDEKIKQCVWFRPDRTSESTITRAHRSKYMLQGGLSDEFVQRNLRVQVDPVLKDVLAAFKKLNKFTHINPDVFNLNEVDVAGHATDCLEAISALIENIGSCRRTILQNLATSIDQNLLDKAITNSAIDELATHHQIDGLSIESSMVIDIGPKDLSIKAEGYIEVELQYGSNFDVRNDMGAVISDSFPFAATVQVKLIRPLGKKAVVSNFNVDTSSWYE